MGEWESARVSHSPTLPFSHSRRWKGFAMPHRLFPILLALALRMPAAFAAGETVSIDDFEAGTPWKMVAGAQRIEGALLAAAGDAHSGRCAGHVSVRLKQAGGWMEFVGGKPACTEDPRARLRLFARPGTAPATLTLRIRDARGETFQSTRFALVPGGAWQEIAVPLDAGAFKESWATGGTKDGVIDFPVTFQSLVFSGTLDARDILIDDIAFLPGEARERVRSIAADFEDGNASAALAWGRGSRAAGCTTRVEVGRAFAGKQALALTVEAQEPGAVAEFALRFRVEPRFADPRRVVARALAPGAGWRLTFRLRDAGGETFQGPALLVPEAGRWVEIGAAANRETFKEHWGGPNDGRLDPPLMLQSLVVTSPAAGTQTLLVDDLGVEEDVPAAQAVAARMATGRLANRFDPKEEVALRVALSSRSVEGKHAGTARLVVTDFEGKQISTQEFPYSLEPGAGMERDVRFRVPSVGFYRPALTLVEGEREVVGATSGVAVFPSAAGQKRAGRFYFGMNAHLDRLDEEDLRREVQLMDEMGIEAARVGVSWGGLEPKEGEFLPERLDRIIASLAGADIEPAVLIGYTAKWATTGDPNAKDWHQWHNAPPRVDAYAAHAGRLARHLRGRVRFYEIWNEPDIGFWLGTSAQYVDLLKAAHAAIKAADRRAQVMNGGYSEVKRRPTFIPEVIAGARDAFDIYAFHTHGGFGNTLIAEADLRRYLAGVPKRPIWLNEAGYASMGPAGDLAQAEALVQKIVFAAAQGWANYMWYDLRDDGTDPTDWEHNYGLVKRDYTPKPAYAAYAHLIATLRGQSFAGPLAGAPNGLYAYRFSGPAGSTLVLWRSPDEPGEAILSLGAPADAEVRGLVGQPMVPLKQKGSLTLSVGRRPVFVTSRRPGAAWPVRPAFVSWPAAVDVLDRGTVGIALRNPGDQPLAGRVEAVCEDPEEWEVSPAEAPFSLAPKGQVALPFEVVRKPGARAGLRSVVRVRVEPRGAGIGEVLGRVGIRRVVPLARQAPAQGLGESAFVPPALERRDQVVELLAAAAMDRQDWKGPADLSARLFAGWSPDALVLEVRAADDVTCWAPVAPDMWQADSLQVGIAVPGRTGHQELGLALIEGKPVVYRWASPDGKPSVLDLPARVTQAAGVTTYHLEIPAKTLGLPAFAPKQRLGLAFLVNDSDGAGRKQWVEWGGGIGRTKEPSAYAVVELR